MSQNDLAPALADALGYQSAATVSKEELAELRNVKAIATELINYVADRYGVTSIGEFTCPIHRRLAAALGKFSKDSRRHTQSALDALRAAKEASRGNR